MRNVLIIPLTIILISLGHLAISQVENEINGKEIVIRFKKKHKFEATKKSDQNAKISLKSENRDIEKLLTRSSINNIELAYSRTNELKPSKYKDELLRTFKVKTSDISILQEFEKYSGDMEVIDIDTSEMILFTPNDFHMPGPNLGVPFTDWGLEIINAEQAWDITKGSSSIKIAIIDTDFDVNHEDLINQIVSITGNPYSGSSCSHAFHGTTVAGFAAAETNNSIGISSIGYNCKLRLYRGLYYSNITDAALDGASVINCSWGSPNSYNAYYETLINAAVNEGAIIVAAAGNTNGQDVNAYYYPASYDNVISVMGIDDSKTYVCINCSDTSHPKSSTFVQNDKVDIAAPGRSIIGGLLPSNSWIENWNIANNKNCFASDDGYGFTNSGTSFSAPIVAGVIGLMLSINPYLSTTEIRDLLKSSGEVISNLPSNLYFKNTYGTDVKLVDAFAAVSLVPVCDNQTFHSVTFSGSQTIEDCNIELNNVTISSGANIIFDIRNDVEITGVFSANTGCVLSIQ